jgi:hypothetical protein
MGYLGSQNPLLNLGINQLYQPISKGINNFASHIPGSTFDEIVPFKNVNLSSQSHSGVQSNQLEKVIMVAYLGGCTYPEISSIRFLKKMYPNYKFIVITNEIINGSRWIDQFVEPGFIRLQNRS